MTRLLAVPLDASDVFLMTFMILQDSYMEPTRVGSDIYIYLPFWKFFMAVLSDMVMLKLRCAIKTVKNVLVAFF